MIDLSDHIARRQLVSRIESDVDAYCRETMQDEPREHMGASVIADPCQAKIWNDFRWLKQEKHTGRQLRLFERGKLEEARFAKWLIGIGFQLREFDETGSQFKIVGCDGHFGGSLDGIAKPPERYELDDLIIFVDEYKTHSEDSFTKLAGKKLSYADLRAGKTRTGGDGVRIAKPMHYGQMCCYGRAYSLKWGLYVAVNKNTDELYFEIVELDWLYADDLFLKADTLIHSQEQPVKIALTETFFQCKMCVHSGICHRGEKPEKNCRSCKRGFPRENGTWKCKDFADGFIDLTTEEIKTGCDNWEPIVNNEQVK